MEKSISDAEPCWRSLPLTLVTTVSDDKSFGAAPGSPMGQNVSKPLARVHCESARCRSRAVTSFNATMERMPEAASLEDARRSILPMISPISPSYSTCFDCGGSSIASPEATTLEGGFRKKSGSLGASFPSSRACSR